MPKIKPKDHTPTLTAARAAIKALAARGLTATHLVMGREVFDRCRIEDFGPLSGVVQNPLSINGPPTVYRLAVLFHPNRNHPPEALTTGTQE